MIKTYFKTLIRAKWNEFNLVRFVTILILFVILQFISTQIDNSIIR